MKRSLKLMTFVSMMLAGSVVLARDPHRLEHWQETIRALKKAGHGEDSEIMHWADHNLKRAETAALHHTDHVKHVKTRTTAKAKSDESWFEKAKEWATGSKPKRTGEVTGVAGTTATATSSDKKVRKPVKTTTRKSSASIDDEKKHQAELAKRRKAYADRKAAEAKAEEEHQEALAKRREAYARKKAEEVKALNLK